MTLQLNLHTTALLVVLFSMLKGRCIYDRPKSLFVDGWYPVTPGQSRSRRNFSDSSSDSVSRQNGRLRPTPTPASAPTPQPWKKQCRKSRARNSEPRERSESWLQSPPRTSRSRHSARRLLICLQHQSCFWMRRPRSSENGGVSLNRSSKKSSKKLSSCPRNWEKAFGLPDELQ